MKEEFPQIEKKKNLETDFEDALALFSLRGEAKDPQVEYAQALFQIDPALHPALYRHLIQQEDRQVGAISVLRAFEGIDMAEKLQLAIAQGLGAWLIGDPYPELDVLALVDDLIRRREISSIIHASKYIDVSLHDAIAQKLMDAGEPLSALFDDYEGGSFKNLSIEVLKRAYDHEAGDLDASRGDYFLKGRHTFSTFIRHIKRFVGSYKDYLTFWLDRHFVGHIQVNFKMFDPPYGRENSLRLLYGPKPSTFFVRIVSDAAHHPSTSVDDPDRLSIQEIFDMFWGSIDGRPMIVDQLSCFFDILTDDYLRALILDGHRKKVSEMLIDISDRETPEQTCALVERMFGLGLSREVVKHYRKLKKGITLDELRDRLVSDGAYDALAQCKEFLATNDDKQQIADTLIEHGQDDVLASHVNNFVRAFQVIPDEPEEEAKQRMREFEALPTIVDYDALARRLLVQFDNEQAKWDGMSEDQKTFSEKHEPDFQESSLMKHYRDFGRLSYETELEIIRRGGGDEVMTRKSVRHLRGEIMSLEHAREMVDVMFATDQADVVARYMNVLGTSVDHSDVARRIIDVGGSDTLIEYLFNFSGLSSDILQRLSQIPSVTTLKKLAEHESSFAEGFSRDVSGRIVHALLDAGNLVGAIQFNDMHDKPDRVLAALYDAFGGNVSLFTYRFAKRVFDGPVAAGLRTRGIEHDGARGLQELFAYLRTLRHRFHAGDISVEDVLHDDMVADWLMQTVGYADGEWGEHSVDSMRGLVRDYSMLRGMGVFAVMPDAYQAPHIMTVRKMRSQEEAVGEQAFVYSEGFLSRYTQLLDSVRASQALAREDIESPSKRANGLRTLIEDFKMVQMALVSELEDKKHDLADRVRERGGDVARAVEGLDARINTLARIDIDAMDHPQQLFSRARQFREFDEVLRRIMFYFSFRYGHAGTVDFDMVERDTPSPSDISTVMNFVDHLTNQETLGPLFTDMHAQKAFRGLLNVSALQEEFNRMSDHLSGVGGVREVRIRCQRNILTEFSGHIGDACWANKMASILRDFPNFISFTLEQNPDDPRMEKLVGAGFLIETQSEDRDPLLVVRGNNPKLSFIDEMDAFDFVYQECLYFERLAKARGRQLCVVMDHVGGAGTNRHAIQRVYAVLQSRLKFVRLHSNIGTQFNGYNICYDTFRISAADVLAAMPKRKKRVD